MDIFGGVLSGAAFGGGVGDQYKDAFGRRMSAISSWP